MLKCGASEINVDVTNRRGAPPKKKNKALINKEV